MISEDLALASYTDADINHALAKMESSKKKKQKVADAEITKQRPVLVSSPHKSGQKRKRLTKGGQPLRKQEAPKNVVPISQEMPEKSSRQEWQGRRCQCRRCKGRRIMPRKESTLQEMPRNMAKVEIRREL
ncbi:hypothetical protein LINPERPRIM_LOCUS39621 [Linum perenne]